MARVQQMERRLGNIAQIGPGSLNRKEGIVLSPYDQRLGLIAAKELMPRVVVFEVFLIVVKKVQLDRNVTWTIKKELVNGVGIRIDARDISYAVCVLEDSRLFREQLANRLLALGIAIRPEGLHRIEGRPDSFRIIV